jgi:preprotein translocase subunit SecG
MFIFFSILIIVACVLLTLVVLIQNPKGGGIASNFASPNQIMGARRSNDVVEKATWILAVILITFSLISNFFRPFGEVEATGAESRLKSNIENAEEAAPMQQQQAPVQTEQAPAAPADSSAQ